MLEFHPTLAMGALALIAIATIAILFDLNGSGGRERTDP